MKKKSNCSICSKKLVKILNLSDQPPANSLHNLKKKLPIFPLVIGYCKECNLAQLTDYPDKSFLFKKYYWVTGTSEVAKNYSKIFYKETSKKIKADSNILEIASNDGTFLKEFKNNGHNILGVDPAKNIARSANLKGIKTLPEFFNYNLSKKIKKNFSPNLIFARNVIPHVSQLKSIIKGMENLSNDETSVVIEFHYAAEILKDIQYDSIYHEHIYYFTIESISKIFNSFNFHAFDVFESPISAGSLVIFFSKKRKKKSQKLIELIKKEKKNKINNIKSWKIFAKKVKKHSINFSKKINAEYNNHGKLFAYGASARSSTLLNYTKLDNTYFDFIIDQNKLKKNLFTPGTNILIKSLKDVRKKLNSYKCMVLLAWNFEKEIKNILKKNGYNGKIIVPFQKK